jgi:hypothetical protein
VCGGGSGVR